MDTQHIRNAYLQRDVTDIDKPFGAFAAEYLRVDDLWLAMEQNVSIACNYILKNNYNVVKNEQAHS